MASEPLTASFSLLDAAILALAGMAALLAIGWWLVVLFDRGYSRSQVLIRWAAVDVPLSLLWAGLAYWLGTR
jgi:hypothetical protein